ncbi:hypothetical protein B0H13DRAFT_1864433 [Mycena leptocephala]|nr:hypothetical protein B0H13DRAFT_1864433 [Mycena leptocephala]
MSRNTLPPGSRRNPMFTTRAAPTPLTPQAAVQLAIDAARSGAQPPLQPPLQGQPTQAQPVHPTPPAAPGQFAFNAPAGAPAYPPARGAPSSASTPHMDPRLYMTSRAPPTPEKVDKQADEAPRQA